MRPTRSTVAVGGLAILLALLAVILADVYLLVGAAIVGAWLVGRQAAFLRELIDLDSDLAIVQSVDDPTVAPQATTRVTFEAIRYAGERLRCTIEANAPVAAQLESIPQLTLIPEFNEARTDTTITWPVAGRHRFKPATITATDGLFEETLSKGPRPTVTVHPHGRRTFHVGAGGGRIAGAFGTHRTDATGPGFETDHLREYVIGDPASAIDWKATARHLETYVREYAAETDREVHLILDHRPTTDIGDPGGTAIEGLVSIALAIIETTRHRGDPLGLITVATDGITAHHHPTANEASLGRMRRHLTDLTPTRTSRHTARSPVSAPTVDRLWEEQNPFTDTLRPFVTDRGAYRRHIEEQPLYHGLETTIHRRHGPGLVVLLTTDADPTELRETIRLARRHEHDVLCYLAPQVLFDDLVARDPTAAYERYVDFEELRRELTAWQGVTALEVGPHERLAEILEAGRRRRTVVSA